MIGKTNSIVVKGGDNPTPATVDKYKGLRPSYWPKIKMPDEFPNDNYIHTQLLLWIPAEITSGQHNIMLFNYTGQITDIKEVNWGDGQTSVSPYVENSHLYSPYTPADAPRGNFYVVEITSTAIPKYYDGNWNDYTDDNFQILEMSCRSNIEDAYKFGILSQYHTKPYIRFVSIHSKNNQIVFPGGNEYRSLLLYPYLKSDIGYITSFIPAPFDSKNLIEIPYIHCSILTIGSGKYTSLPAPNNETGEQLVYSSIGIATAIDEYGYPSPSSLDVLPIPDSGSSYMSLTVQPNVRLLDCLKIADLSQLLVNYQSGGQENYSSDIWGRGGGCVFSPKISIDSNDTSAKGIFRECKNLQEATIISWGGLSDEDGLQNAFYNCQRLQIVHMPENSLKVSIDLSAITSSSENYTDPETGNSYSSTADFLIQTVAKGLYNFTSAGETPSYTPTLTLSNYINSYASSIYIDGIQFPEYVANKGWTIAEV